MLDTNIAIHLRDGSRSVSERVAGLSPNPSISIVTRIELEGGQHRNPADAAARLVRLDEMLFVVPVVAFGDDAAVIYRQIIAVRGFSRSKLLDRMIAAHAMSRRATLVTMNGADFRDIPELSLDIWPAD